MITFDRIQKKFSSGISSKMVLAVNDLTLSINKGEIFGIVGPNGAGKSTMLKMLMGFIRPSSGAISIFGLPPNVPESRINIGYLPENPYYYDHLSAEDLMKFSGTTSGLSASETGKRIDYLLEKMDLVHARKRKLRTYSKGMTQRAGICFSLVHDPDIIVFDEPMSGLDPLGRKLVVDLIFELKEQGKTVLFCSHILNDVERLCDRMAMMDLGNLKEIFTKENIIKTYGLVTLKIDSLPAEAKESFEKIDTKIESVDEFYTLKCVKSVLPDIFNITASNSINILEIDTESNILENMFIDIINKRLIV